MITFKITKEFGKVCVNGSKAKVYADTNIVPHLEKGKRVRIDFNGVEMASSSFINSIVFNTYGYEIVKDQVKYVSSDDLIKSMLDVRINKLENELER